MAYCGFLIATRPLANNKLPEGPLARMHLIATSGKSLLCLALPRTKAAAPVGGCVGGVREAVTMFSGFSEPRRDGAR